MVKRTLELFECDRCGKEAKRYTVLFEDGTKVLDRCALHAKKIEALREEAGEWIPPRGGKSSFRKTDIRELRLAVEQERTAADEAG